MSLFYSVPVMTTCLPPVNYPLPSNDKLKQGSPKSPRSPRTSPEGKSGMSSPKDSRHRIPSSPTSPRSAVTPPATPPVTPSTPEMTSVPKLQQPPPTTQHIKMTSIKTTIKGGDGLVRYSFELDVDYITERLIAVSFPSGGLENQYRSNLRDVVRMLKSKHSNSYVVFNLSRRRHDITKLNHEVRDLGWPDVLAPPLERLCSICKQIETFLKTNPNNVVVLHCKGGRGPIGVVVSAFMNYMNITSSVDTSLDRYAMKRFLDAKIVGNMHPSQCRYVDYFIGLLTNSIQINSAPLYLHHVLIHGVPNYDSNGGCRPFLRIYQGMHPVYTSGVYTVPEGTGRFAITPNRAIPLRGDILLKCYHKKFRSTTRDTVFRCQFHTTAVMEYRLVFHKTELDDACTDARFPEFTKVELIFSSTPDSLHGSDYVSGANFPSELIDDPLIRWDSYEHFNDIIEGPEDGGNDLMETSGNNNNNMILDIPHSPAPDGSLYAQVKKTPSPEQSPLLTHTQMVNGGTQPYVVTPEKSPVVNGPRHGGGTSSSSTPSTPSTIRQQPSPNTKRHMDYKERMALDELLKGITGEDIHVTVNNNTHWKGPPSPENVQILRQEPVHTRRIVSVSEDLRKAPVNQKPQQIPVKEPITEEAPQVNNASPKKTPVTRKASGDSENPYAEIPEAMQKGWLPNPNTNLSGPSEEAINPQTQTQQEHAAPPMMNGGVEIPRSSEQHNPTYEYTRNGAKVGNPRTTPNGPAHLSHNPGPNHNPGPSHGTHNPGPHQMTHNPGPSHTAHNPGPSHTAHNPGTPHVAQMNGPVETTIVPNAHSRPTEHSPNLTRLDGNPSTSSPNPHQYQPKPLVARQERILIVRKEPNEPLLPQQAPQQYAVQKQVPLQQVPQQYTPQQHTPQQQTLQQKSPQPSPTGWSDPNPGSVDKSTTEDDDGGLNWLRRQQDKLREKREREQGRPIVRESPLKKGPSSSSPKLHVAESLTMTPVSVTPVNAIPVSEPEQRTTEPKVRFEMDNIQQSEPVTSPPPPVNGSLSWLEQQQQKLRERRAQEQATSVNQSPIVASTSTPVNASPLVPRADTPSQDSGVSSRRDHTPAPLTISKDLQSSIDSLGNVGPKSTPSSYLHQTITTTTTTKTEWQPHERPLNRQMSDLTHDRVRDAVFQRPIADQYPKTPQTPYDPVPPVLSPSRMYQGTEPQATSTPRKDFDEIDLHIDEPMESVIPRGVVADRSPNYMDRSMSPPPPHPNRSRPPRRTNSQSGYDSDTGIQQYYRPPRRRNLIDPGAEVWLQNPGGLPQKETQYWNRSEGLKSPDAEEMEKEKPRPVEYDWSSSTESIPGNSRTPKFPVGPKAYANMVKTCIAVVGKPPHGPDEPLPLSPLRRQDSDTFDNGPLPLPQGREVYTPPPSYSTVTIETSPLYTERREVQMEELSPVPPSPGRSPTIPIEARVEKIPRRHLEFIESEPRVGSAGDTKPYQQPVVTNLPQSVPPSRAEPQRWNAQPQQVVTTVVPTSGPQTVTTIQWREEIVRQPVDVKPIEAETQEEVEARKPRSPTLKFVNDVQEPEATPSTKIERPLIPRYVREVNAAPPTEPLPPASEPEAPLPQVQSRVQPRVIQYVEPQVLPKPRPSPIVEPPITEVRLHGVELGPIRSVPVDAQVVVENRSQVPGYPTPASSYQGAPTTSTAPPATSVAYQAQVPTQQASPTPISRGIVQPAPQVAVVTSPGQESPIIQQRVDVKQVHETQNVPSPQIQPKQQQQQQQQQQPLTNEQLLNRPTPGVQYPTFSDRHRKAARGPAEDAPGLTPNGGAGYRTLYDNRKQRSSLGNEGQLPSPGGISTTGTTRTAVNGNATPPTTLSGRSTPSNFYYTQKLSPYGSSSSLADPSVEHVRFVKDLSAWWYKPNISRDDAINMLKDKAPGTFVVRDSNSFPGAFGLALKVAQLPANTAPRKGGDPQSELVRHFLIEPNARGVRLKGCANEPIFGSLSALIYQHTLTQLALPIKLMLPDTDPSGSDSTDAALDSKSAAALLSQGAACKVLYIQSIDMESLTGSEAVREAMTRVLNGPKKPQAVVVHFKVSSKGVTLTDLQRKVFFRKHYPVESILYSGMDPLTRKYPRKEGQEEADAKIFGVVARKPGSLTDNQCHLFADYEVEQPASAIVSFVTKVLLGMGKTTSPKTP